MVMTLEAGGDDLPDFCEFGKGEGKLVWKLFRVDPTSPPQRTVIPAYRQAGRAHFEVLPKFLESYSGRGIFDI